MITDGTKMQAVKAQAGIDPNRKGMDIAQAFGSSSSYARKYALNGLFLIDDTKDSDATNKHDKQTSKPKMANDRFKEALVAIDDKRYTLERLKNEWALTPAQLKQL